MEQYRKMEQYKEYIYDGSFTGFLTTAYHVLKNKEKPARIVRKEDHRQALFGSTMEIESDEDKADRLSEAIREEISHKSFKYLHHAFLSEYEDIELTILDSLVICFKENKKIEECSLNESIKEIKKAAGKVRRENHRYKGLLRFRQLSDGSLYAPFNPEHNITGLLIPHFASRLSTEEGMIHDRERDTAAIFSRGEWELLDAGGLPTPDTGDYAREEENYQQLWRTFFDFIAIEERKNPELQKSLMPKKYRDYLVERPQSGPGPSRRGEDGDH